MARIIFQKERTKMRTGGAYDVLIEDVASDRAFLRLIKGKMIDEVHAYPTKPGHHALGMIGFKDGSVVDIIHSGNAVKLRYDKRGNPR